MWGWFPSSALPATPGLYPRKTTTRSTKGPPHFDPHWDGHCLCCRLEPHRQQLPPKPPLGDQLWLQPHDGSGAPQVPFLRSSHNKPVPVELA